MTTQKVTTLDIGQATDIGRGSGKEQNEDSAAVFDVRLAGGPSPDGRVGTLAIVADGMGGMSGGAEASSLGVSMVRTRLEGRLLPVHTPDAEIAAAIHAANQAINHEAEQNHQLEGMGTTMVSALVVGDRLFLSYVGDSRVYLLRSGALHQLSRDHTWVQDALDKGRLSQEEARSHPNRHVLKRHLGMQEALEVDNRIADPTRAADPPTFVTSLPLVAGDTLLLCSDGLSDPVSEEQLQDTLGRGSAQQCADELVRLANAAGGRDNITAVVVRVPGGTFAPIRRTRGPLPIMPIVLAFLVIGLLATGFVLLNGRQIGGVTLPDIGGIVPGQNQSDTAGEDSAGGSGPRGPQLPTPAPGEPGFVTSTAAPGAPTSTPVPIILTTTAVAAAPPGTIRREVLLLLPNEGATISQDNPGFSAQVTGLQPGDAVVLLLGSNSNLGTGQRVATMQRSGDRFVTTLRSLNLGTYFWAVVVYSSDNREVARSTIRRFVVASNVAPATNTAEPPPPATRTSAPPPATQTSAPPPPKTNTPVPPPPATNTPVPPPPATNTPVPPPTNTPVPPPTNTPVPPPTNTPVPPPLNTPTPPIAVNTPTATPVPGP